MDVASYLSFELRLSVVAVVLVPNAIVPPLTDEQIDVASCRRQLVGVFIIAKPSELALAENTRKKRKLFRVGFMTTPKSDGSRKETPAICNCSFKVFVKSQIFRHRFAPPWMWREVVLSEYCKRCCYRCLLVKQVQCLFYEEIGSADYGLTTGILQTRYSTA